MPARKGNPMKVNSCLVLAAITLIIASGCVYAASAQTGDALAVRVNRVLAQTPLIDGHNDLAWQIVGRLVQRSSIAGADRAPCLRQSRQQSGQAKAAIERR
jgi:hypothetical protein